MTGLLRRLFGIDGEWPSEIIARLREENARVVEARAASIGFRDASLKVASDRIKSLIEERDAIAEAYQTKAAEYAAAVIDLNAAADRNQEMLNALGRVRDSIRGVGQVATVELQAAKSACGIADEPKHPFFANLFANARTNAQTIVVQK